MDQGDILFDKYELVRNIGSGSFGDVWKGKNINTGEIVAVKIEKVEKAKTRLESEKNICQQLRGEGVPEVFYYGNIEDGTKALVMSYLGPSLENLFDFCNGDAKTHEFHSCSSLGHKEHYNLLHFRVGDK